MRASMPYNIIWPPSNIGRGIRLRIARLMLIIASNKIKALKPLAAP
jgi:hypothetical protein